MTMLPNRRSDLAGVDAVAAGDTWSALNFTSWTVTPGTTADLVTAVSSTQVDIAAKSANTPAAATRLGGDATAPEIAAGKRVQIHFKCTNLGTRAAGILVGIWASGAAHGLAGPFESASNQEWQHTTNGGVFVSAAVAGIEAVVYTAEVDVDGRLCRWSAVWLNSSNQVINTDSGEMDVDPAATVYLAAMVRHGTNLGPGAVAYGYEGKYLVTDLVPA